MEILININVELDTNFHVTHFAPYNEDKSHERAERSIAVALYTFFSVQSKYENHC